MEHSSETTRARQTRAILMLAAPIGLAELCQMAMGITDTVLLGHLGTEPLAVGGLSTGLYFTILMVFQSGLAAGGVLIAQAMGAKRQDDISSIHVMTVVMGLALCLPCLGVLLELGPILRATGESEHMVAQCRQFVSILLWSLPAVMIGLGVVRAVLPALEAQRLLLWVMPVMTVLNGLLNAGLIFGLCGLPRMGLWGSATASTLTCWLMAIVLYAGAHWPHNLRRLLLPWQFRPALLAPLLRLGVPMVLSACAELMLFQVCSVRAGLLGVSALAANQIALGVISLTFMISLALSQAANVRVGYWVGAKKPDSARRAGHISLALATGYNICSGAVLLFMPDLIAGFYLDPGVAGNAQTLLTAARILRVGALFQIVDGIQVVTNGILRGHGDTMIPMIIAIAGYWGVGFPLGGWLAFHLHWGVVGLWYGLAGGLTFVAASLSLRLAWVTRKNAPLTQPGF